MKKTLFLGLLAALLVAAGPALAAKGPVGLRLGYTEWEGTSQIHFGAHMEAGEMFPNVDFTPNVELGLGDNYTTLAINGDLAYRFSELVGRPWAFLAGGSLSAIYVNPDFGDDNLDLGLSALAKLTKNFKSGRQGMVEMRLGLLDSPGFKLTFGTTLF